MLVQLRSSHNQIEAKYNVTTEFPSLGLHAAASTGDIGLVRYALERGQPANSVLDGVLPLHAACAGGHVQVVKLLIEHGADVNAPRLPRRYSNDRNRDASAPKVGASGSVPLHFAAANGALEVIQYLLLHGAHADRPDKHGVTPEALAKENGWLECANFLRDWVLNKDRDLREREGPVEVIEDPRCHSVLGFVTRDRARSPPLDGEHGPLPSTSRRRLHMKHSIDTALNMLKSSSSGLSESYRKSQYRAATPTPPVTPNGEHTHPPQGSQGLEVSGTRRPSLPHIFQTNPDVRLNEPFLDPDDATSQRPRSAGSGAEPLEPERVNHIYGRGGAGRKLGSKYSLLNLFKRAQISEGSGNSGVTHEPRTARHSSSVSSMRASISPIDTTTTHRISSSFSQDSSFLRSRSPEQCPDISPYRFNRDSDSTGRSTQSPPHSHQPARPPLQILHRQPSSGLRSSYSVSSGSNSESRELASSIGGRRVDNSTHTVNIDIKSISSRAEAEALVQRVRQDVLETATSSMSSAVSHDRQTPLSVKLAMYGESLALERRLRLQEEQAKRLDLSDSDGLETPCRPAHSSGPSGYCLGEVSPADYIARVERQLSLGEKPGTRGMRVRTTESQRPSTTEGTSSKQANGSFTSEQLSGRSHQSSLATSMFGHLLPAQNSSDHLEYDVGEEQGSQSGDHAVLSRSLPDRSIRHMRSISQSQTSAVEAEAARLSRISSLDGSDSDTNTSLYDSPTMASSSVIPARVMHKKVRNTKKLSKMGFPTTEQAGRPLPSAHRGFLKSIVSSWTRKA